MLLPALLLTFAQDPLAVRPDSGAVRHDALHYDVALTLPAAGTRIAAEVRVRWRILSAEPVLLNLDTTMTPTAALAAGATAPWQRDGRGIAIGHRASPGDTIETVLRYEGHPTDGLVIRGEGTSRTIFADNWPDRARRWLASQDHPSDKATVTWRIAAPRGLTVVANGTRTAVDTSGDRVTWTFELVDPTPVHTMVVGAATLTVTRLGEAQCAVRCVPVSVFSYPKDSAWAVDGPFRRAVEMVDVMSRLFGPFPYGELRHVQSSTIFGGMENSTAVFYSDRAWANRQLGEGTVAHETVHQWFGDAVSQGDWHHLWLSEGFATYGAALWAEHTDGGPGLRQAMSRSLDAVRRSAVRDRPIVDPEATDLMRLLNANNYQKGSWVLHSLRGLTGDESFFRLLRTFAERYRHGNALSRTFADLTREVTGTDYDWYFRQALTQPGYPVLEVWTRRAGADSVTVEITQVQDPSWGLYRLPGLTVRVGERDHMVNVEGPVVRVTVPWSGAGSPPVAVDPAGWWLLEVRGR